MIELVCTILFSILAILFLWRGFVVGKRYTWIYSAARTLSVILAILLSLLASNLLARGLIGSFLSAFGSELGDFGGLLETVPTLADAICALGAMILAPIFFFVFFFILKGILCKISGPVSRVIFRAVKKKAEKKAEASAPAETAEASAPAEEAPVEVAIAEEAPVAEESAEEAPAEEASAEAASAEEAIVTDAVISEAPAEEEPAEEAPAEEAPVEEAPKKKKKVKKKDQLRVQGANPVGILLGCACAVLMFVAIFAPFIGFMTTVDRVMDLVCVFVEDDVVYTVEDVTDGVANNPVSKTVKVLGGNAIYSGLTTYPVGEYRVSLQKEMNLVDAAGLAIADVQDSTVTDAEAAYSVRQVAHAFDESALLPTLMADFLSAANQSWSEGRDFYGIDQPSLGEDMEGVEEPLFDLLARVDQQAIKDDVHTVVELMAIAVENGALRSDEIVITELLTDEKIGEPIMVAILDNSHISPLLGDVLSFAFDQIGEGIDAHFDGDVEEDDSVEYASMDDLNFDSSKVQNKAQEAKVLVNILKQSFDLIESMGDDFDAVVCIEKIGPLLDSFAESETIGKENTKIFLTCVLQAEDVYQAVGFTLAQATDMANTITRDIGTKTASGKVNNYASLMKTVSSAIKVVQLSANQDDYSGEMDLLLQDLTPTSANMLSQMMSASVLEKHDVSGDSAEQTSQMISSVFTNLANEREHMTDEEYERETAAVVNLTDLAMNAGKEGTDGAFGEGSATGVEADEFVGNILDSKSVSKTMKEQVFVDGSTEPTIDPLNKGATMSDEDVTELEAAMTERWEQEDQTDEETKMTYVAIGAMIGMNVDFSSGSITLTAGE